MPTEITEAAVRSTLESVEFLARVGAGDGLFYPDDIAVICRSWLEQHEALRWVPVSSGSLPPKLETVRLWNGKSSWLGRACDCGTLPPHDLSSGLPFTHFQKIPPPPKEGE